MFRAAAVALREGRTITPNGGPRAPSWAQLLRCGRCGRPLWFRYGGRGLASTSYRCAGAGRGGCNAPQFGAELVESSVLDLADLLALPPADLGAALEAIYADDGEITSLAPKPAYRRLLARLGYKIKS